MQRISLVDMMVIVMMNQTKGQNVLEENVRASIGFILFINPTLCFTDYHLAQSRVKEEYPRKIFAYL